MLTDPKLTPLASLCSSWRSSRLAKQRKVARLFWLSIGIFSLSICVNAQDARSQYHGGRRRPLPTVIITREHLRQRPALYGPYGDTAAEFIVSAGLDTSQSSAVRIRKLGNKRDNSTISSGPASPPIRINGPISPQDVSSRNNLVNNNNNVNIAFERRQPPVHPQSVNRRQDVLNERNNIGFHHQRFFPSVDVNVNGPVPRYVPPIFVPYYQQQQNSNRGQVRPPHEYRPSAIVPSGWRPSVPDGFDHEYRTANKPSETRKPLHEGKDKVKNPVIEVDGDKTNPEETNGDTGFKPSRDQQNDKINKSNVAHKNIVAETPVLRLNRVKPDDAKNLIIRRPSLVLRDQITVNEVNESPDRPRYGPRALQFEEEISRTSRRKRQADSDEMMQEKFSHFQSKRLNGNIEDSNETDAEESNSDSEEISTERNGSLKFGILPSLKKILDEFKKRSQRMSRQYAFQGFDDPEVTNRSQLNTTAFRYGSQSPFYSDVNYPSQMDQFPPSSNKNTEGEVMSFSDFLASPMAERIRLQRQLMFRNSTLNGNLTNENSNSSFGMDSLMHNATVPLLKNVIAARILHSMLNLDSSNISKMDYSFNETSNPRSSTEGMELSEQRQFGIVVSPYDGLESLNSKSTMPIIRILKGKIVPLPELPQELIPILMGTYRPTYTSEASYDDPKLTESITDNALLTLLQNEEMMNLRPLNRKLRPMINRYHRKSPSTNYVGSLKASEPISKTSYSFKPAEWSLGPRCDRLTEEICLEDSDYPSSAIMSSIYKDKAKFDLMYAELKVRESQVEGLSRQQEQSYSFDHYYGPYTQASGSSLVPRDYGQSEDLCVHPKSTMDDLIELRIGKASGKWGSGNPCKYVVSPMQSTCAQVYSYHRLLVFNKELGLHIDLFRVPASCTCHLRPGQQESMSKFSSRIPYSSRPSPYEEYGGHVETAPSSQMVSEGSNTSSDKKNSFGSTLWAILGGGQQAGALAQQPQFLDEVQKQISWTQQLKQFPQLMKQISPNQVLKQLLEDDEDELNIRRQRIRQPADRLHAGGFASHHIPISVPLPPPPPPPMVIARRPVVGAATPDQKHMFGLPVNSHAKVIAISPTESTKVFSLTKQGNPGKTIVRLTESSPQAIFGGSAPSTVHQVTAYKVRPGMYHPSSNTGEKIQVTEASLVPIAPQFSDQSGSEGSLRPILKPMPVPKGSNKRIVEDEDLIAIEKSEGDEIHTFTIETVTEEQVTENQATENSSEDGSKINFSYHPILEYLNL
ncbi:neurotrophin 1 [Trichonephila inaurata madagascariensis]|uniref:Neurotrophin 1 n=1 Tax=Trichonephila inaurata madagascariensis TaxID=2747483 RepID=A0A8X7C8Z0_9ARAC|nr:neurotrophin 1 [Trichonephila inaurata madagascariensis]